MSAVAWRVGAALALTALLASARAEEVPVERAASLYQRNCAACHGERGDGRSRARESLATKPRDFTGKDARRELPREYMVAIVRDGKHEKPMVGRKSRLTEAEIEAVIDFIRAAFMPPAPGTPNARGLELYRVNCAGCHGDRGQGGVEHGTLRIPAISRAQGRAGLTRDAMAAALAAPRHGTLRGGFGAKLGEDDREAIVDYVRTAFVESAGGAR